MKYYWEEWKDKSKLEESAIKTVLRAVEIVTNNIPKDKVESIYVGGSFVRREMNSKSDVDTWTIVNDNSVLAEFEKLSKKYKNTTKPEISLAVLSLWELKNNKHYIKPDRPRATPSRFVKKLPFVRNIYGKKLNPNDFPIFSDREDLEGMIEGFRKYFIPLYKKGKFAFSSLVKAVFWLTEAELGYLKQKRYFTWEELVRNVGEKHIVRDAWVFRIDSYKDESKRKAFLDKLSKHIEALDSAL